MSALPSTGSLQETLTRAVKADPRKSGLLFLLLAVLVGLWVWKSQDPSSGPANAAASLSAATGTPNSVIRRDEPAALGTATASHGGPGPASELSGWLAAPIAPLGRNLFAVKLDYFPRNGASSGDEILAGQGFWDELAKSLSSRADERKEHQVLIENLQQQAGQLRLQSTLMGPSPRAVINGAMVGEGGVVEGFRVLGIEPRRIIIEREGIRLEVPMR
jgi:hypothetical protein